MTLPPAGPDARDVRRGDDRPSEEHSPGAWATHSFSFGAYYDPANLGFGPMVCHDDHRLAPGAGYADHPHSDLEVVTWVLDGALVHRSPSLDGAGALGVLGPGQAQVLSAGSGVVHSETGDAGAGPTRFVQTWLRPDEAGARPSYARVEGATAPASSGLVPVAGAGGPAGVGVAGATLWVAGCGTEPAVDLVLPEAPLLHVYVARGAAGLEDGVGLDEGDAVRLHEAGGVRVRLTRGAELLVWSFAGR
ncbi:pirin family protein [Nocardioides sp. CFH 31398]|uniref:pirin family protein n=1 Tax=Nocardioides sp. CFH 31398 TaxID=2919579 RepID=UPI001F05C43A|nr:pirin family protein [Nocardioides sp. CFH 31398]MCH1867920.1 pirin family protein [Nocardioides sp. CFH 31398]